MKSLFKLSLLAAIALVSAVHAADEIEISKTFTPGSTPPIKVNIAGFTGEVNDVLNFDLYVMGFINVPADQAQFLIAGSNNSNVQGTVSDKAVMSVSVLAANVSAE